MALGSPAEHRQELKLSKVQNKNNHPCSQLILHQLLLVYRAALASGPPHTCKCRSAGLRGTVAITGRWGQAQDCHTAVTPGAILHSFGTIPSPNALPSHRGYMQTAPAAFALSELEFSLKCSFCSTFQAAAAQ